jgi:hypothetical protein
MERQNVDKINFHLQRISFTHLATYLKHWSNTLHFMDVSMPNDKHAYVYTYIKQHPRTGCEQRVLLRVEHTGDTSDKSVLDEMEAK